MIFGVLTGYTAKAAAIISISVWILSTYAVLIANGKYESTSYNNIPNLKFVRKNLGNGIDGKTTNLSEYMKDFNNIFMKIDIETKYKVLDVISKSKISNQRSIADQTKYSLGKVNYVVNQLIEVGFLKFENFRNAENKKNYAYILTPSGLSEKIKITQSFIERKEQEYIELKAEIEALKAEKNSKVLWN